MKEISIPNKLEKIAIRKRIVKKAVRTRAIARFFGGVRMTLSDYMDCPKVLRWLWHIHNNAQTTIFNTNLEIGWLETNSRAALNLR